MTFVLKLPVRNPVLVAKQATSTAVLTGNRLLLGVGTSPWREDYDILGVPWERRGRRMDESIDIIRGLAAGGYFGYDGEVLTIPPVKLSPVPTAADPDPARRPQRGHAAPGGAGRRRLDARRRRSGRSARAAGQARASCGGPKGRPTGHSRCT